MSSKPTFAQQADLNIELVRKSHTELADRTVALGMSMERVKTSGGAASASTHDRAAITSAGKGSKSGKMTPKLVAVAGGAGPGDQWSELRLNAVEDHLMAVFGIRGFHRFVGLTQRDVFIPYDVGRSWSTRWCQTQSDMLAPLTTPISISGTQSVSAAGAVGASPLSVTFHSLATGGNGSSAGPVGSHRASPGAGSQPRIATPGPTSPAVNLAVVPDEAKVVVSGLCGRAKGRDALEDLYMTLSHIAAMHSVIYSSSKSK